MKTEIIDGRYRIIDNVRPDTFVCENISTGVKWILKKMEEERCEAAHALGFIRHPALPRLVEIIRCDGSIYAVFEYINGSSLADVCTDHDGSTDLISGCKYVRDIAQAVHFLHTNEPYPILHLDIKPSNIVVQDDGKACLIDFGSLIVKNEDASFENIKVTTTELYAPYEILSGLHPSCASDIYMLGMTLLRILTGVNRSDMPDFEDRTICETIPSHLLSIISKCIMYAPEDRFKTANELSNELNDVISEAHLFQIPEKTISTDKGKVICIWGNPYFASELSFVLSDAGYNTLLIDADLLAPAVDKLTGIKDKAERKTGMASTRCSLGVIMNEYASGRLNPDRITNLSDMTFNDKLKCICGDYRMEDYEHYSTEGLAAIIKNSVKNFDTVLVASSKFIYDEFTCISFICSDRIIVPVTANQLVFREFMKYVEFLAARRQIKKEKIFFCGFEHRSDEDLGSGTCQELCQGRYLGAISFSSRRRMLAGSSKPYVRHMEPKIRKQYIRIIEKLKLR